MEERGRGRGRGSRRGAQGGRNECNVPIGGILASAHDIDDSGSDVSEGEDGPFFAPGANDLDESDESDYDENPNRTF